MCRNRPLLGKAPDNDAGRSSGMDADQVAAVVADAADKVDNLTVAENASVSLTLAELNDLRNRGLTPINGDNATTGSRYRRVHHHRRGSGWHAGSGSGGGWW